MDYRSLQISHFEHDCFRLVVGGKVVYLDPFNLKTSQSLEADYIFISHGHFDHCSRKDINKIAALKTTVVAAQECAEQLKGLRVKELLYVAPGQVLTLPDLTAEVTAAYNINKFRSAGVVYHPQADSQVGYLLDFFGVRLYHSGDTDFIPEMAALKNVDLALLPVSGTYVMTVAEAILAAKAIKPVIAIPMHYGSVIGSLDDAYKFKDLAEPEGIKVEII